MNENWDRQVAPLPIWKECYRVLKAGSFAFVMSIPRQDLLTEMILTLKEAGFIIGFSSIYWSYAQGFTKSKNMSKAIDKRICKRELTKKLGRKPTKKELDEVWSSYRKRIRLSESWRPCKTKGGAGFEKQLANIGRTEDKEYKFYVTEPRNPEAKALDGAYAGFQPRPAVEIILVVMKPLSEASYTSQAMKTGKSVTWLNNGRIPVGDMEEYLYNKLGRTRLRKEHRPILAGGGWEDLRNDPVEYTEGRFPANLLISDNILDTGKRVKSSGGGKHLGAWHGRKGLENKPKTQRIGHGDVVDFSDYYSLDAWWSEKIKLLPKKIQKTHPFWIIPKPSQKEKHRGCEDLVKVVKRYINGEAMAGPMQEKEVRGNWHPTVKPMRLFAYLITIGSRKNDLILDPFLGSGTTVLACKYLRRKYIGIEIDEEYMTIARRRVKAISQRKNIRSLFKRIPK